jgi:hypothetical protein
VPLAERPLFLKHTRQPRERNGTFIDDDRHLSDAILDHFHDIVKSARHSAMKPNSAKLFVMMRKDFAMRNEDTFLGNIKPLIFKSTREVENSSSIPNETAESDSENWATKPTSDSLFMERSNIDDHLDSNMNRIHPRLHPFPS